MHGSRPSHARQPDRWFDRWGRAFVTEIELGDGTRALLSTDPTGLGVAIVVLAADPAGRGDGRAATPPASVAGSVAGVDRGE